MSKHTKGPWIQSRSDKLPDTVRIGNGVAITNEANANLIAAAPELLETLKEALNILDALTFDRNDQGKEIYERLLSVVTKAEGRES